MLLLVKDETAASSDEMSNRPILPGGAGQVRGAALGELLRPVEPGNGTNTNCFGIWHPPPD